jgi:L-cysteine desulfidase
LSLQGEKYNAYLTILREELVPALGCTEPIAIAYAAAKSREILGKFPEKVIVKCSGNIIKNAKSVTVPNTEGLRGIKASALAGIVAGNAEKGLEVISNVKDFHIEKIKELMESELCEVNILENDANLHIVVQAVCSEEAVLVEIIHTHTNICRIEKNGEILFSKEFEKTDFNSALSDRSILSISDIFEFANTVRMEDVEELLSRQVEYNLEIALEGLNKKHGVNIGKMILECYGDNVISKIRAYAAAGSDARMNGCSLPVVTNSGSGNQGMTTSLPVIIYAQEKNIDKERMYRGLVLANLVTIHQKTGLGRLSAYCGAVSAACGSGAGITYLEGGSLEQIGATIVNTLANVSGIVCDGAKASCAAKIASSVDAAIMAHFLAMRGTAFEADTGLVKKSVEATISAIGRLGRDGMKETDLEVLKIMLDQ